MVWVWYNNVGGWSGGRGRLLRGLRFLFLLGVGYNWSIPLCIHGCIGGESGVGGQSILIRSDLWCSHWREGGGEMKRYCFTSTGSRRFGGGGGAFLRLLWCRTLRT